jgi:hypothetical protein
VSPWLVAYWLVALWAFGVSAWATGQGTPLDERTAGWYVRRWIVIVFAVVWPSTVLLAVVWQFPAGRESLTQLVLGRAPGHGPT